MSRICFIICQKQDSHILDLQTSITDDLWGPFKPTLCRLVWVGVLKRAYSNWIIQTNKFQLLKFSIKFLNCLELEQTNILKKIGTGEVASKINGTWGQAKDESGLGGRRESSEVKNLDWGRFSNNGNPKTFRKLKKKLAKSYFPF